MSKICFILPFLALVAACSDPATSPHGRATLKVTPDTVQAELHVTPSGTRWLTFDIDLAITNSGGTDLVLGGCGGVIEQFDGVRWNEVWTPACRLVITMIDVLPAGETRRMPLSIAGVVSGSGGPEWRGQGSRDRYRMVYPIQRWFPEASRIGALLPKERRVSNVFVVKIP